MTSRAFEAASILGDLSPTLHRTLNLVGRGGHQKDYLEIASHLARGGASTTPGSLLTTAASTVAAAAISGGGGEDNVTDGFVTPQAKAVLFMATAMALHYLGYSFARPSSLALFTSKEIGFKNPAAFPLAMAFISPVSLCLLMGYGYILERDGPRSALIRTTVFCAMVLISTAFGIWKLQSLGGGGPLVQIGSMSVPVLKLMVGFLFIFRESYVQLLTSQQWSFMSSVVTPAQSTTWFAPISGLTSFLSALAGLGVTKVVNAVGLTGTMALAGVALLVSLIMSEQAYAISDKYGFNPADEHFEKKANEEKEKQNPKKTAVDEKNMVQKASDLFKRVPTLGRLFSEILACQALSTLLNVCFVTKLSATIPDDAVRAGWTGKLFATINLISMGLQFGFIPFLMKVVQPAWVWRFMPTVMVCMTSFQCLQANPSLYIVAGSYMMMKIMEFSMRRMLDEMVYVPLDYESRYVGKEVIGVFGYRFGKSGMSLALSGLSSLFGNFGLQELSCFTTAAACAWFACVFRLSNLVPTRAEAEEAYKKQHAEGKKK